MSNTALPFQDPDFQRREKTRDTLVATLVAYAKVNNLAGDNVRDALHEAFPSVPSAFISDAMCELAIDRSNAYLDELSKTIEGEIVRRAIAGNV